MVLRQREAQAEEGITDPTELAQWRGLSKQHQVDCTFVNSPQDLAAEFNFDSSYIKNYGCGGGRQDWTWEFIKKYGAMWEDNYRSYASGNTLLEGDCEHRGGKNAAIKVKDWYKVQANPHAIKRELKKAPLAVAIGAASKLYGYKSGVIEQGDESWCTANLNHAVTLVGYTPGELESRTTTTQVVPQCRRKLKKDADGCRKKGEYTWE